MDPAFMAKQFNVAGRLVAITPTGTGNVNETYLAVFRTHFSEERCIVQRINKRVFTRPEWIMENMRVLTDHVYRRLEQEEDEADRIWQLPRLIPARDGRDFAVDDDGEYWRAITLIASANSHDKTQGAEHAFEAGAVLGQFHRLVSDLDPTLLRDTLPGFHVTRLCLQKYDQTVTTPAAARRLKSSMEARRLNRFVEARRSFASILEDAQTRGDKKRPQID